MLRSCFALRMLSVSFDENLVHGGLSVGNMFLSFRWHSAGTYDVKTKTGGPFGTMRHSAELAHGANNGLDISLRLLEPIREQFPILSHADFYQVRILVPLEDLLGLFKSINILAICYLCFLMIFSGACDTVGWCCCCGGHWWT